MYFLGGPAILGLTTGLLVWLFGGGQAIKKILEHFYKYSHLGYDGPDLPATRHTDTISRRTLSFSVSDTTKNPLGDDRLNAFGNLR